jgi:YD repeat-containing protein
MLSPPFAATATPTATATATATATSITRTIDYTYDGVQRLTGAVESPGSSFAHRYDLAGNRTGVTVNGTAILTDTYDAADQVVGWTYDATNDLTGTTTIEQPCAYSYNGGAGQGDRHSELSCRRFSRRGGDSRNAESACISRESV